MLARLSLKIALGAIGAIVAVAALCMALDFLATAFANALISSLGPVYGYAVAGGLIMMPFLLAILVLSIKLHKFAAPAKPPLSHTVARSLFSALAQQAPWIAAGGAGLVAAAEVFLNRKK